MGDGVLFVVEMLRWGDRENHSYVIGVYSSQTLAALAGEAEKTPRPGQVDYLRRRRRVFLRSCRSQCLHFTAQVCGVLFVHSRKFRGVRVLSGRELEPRSR
jgi:hypothetical protein